VTTPTFSSVAARAIGQYGQAGRLIVDGYRSGALRLARGVNSRYAEFLDKRQLPLVNDAVKTSLKGIEMGVVAILEQGIIGGSDRAEQIIGKLADGVTRSIRRVAETAARVEAAFETKAISNVSGFSMPAANASLELSSLALEGTKRLSARMVDGRSQTIGTPEKPTRLAKRASRRTKSRA
jgi:hypothetical protein